jgi:hypothetical protein
MKIRAPAVMPKGVEHPLRLEEYATYLEGAKQ